MATGLGPKFVIDGPRPRPPKYRLLDVANIIDEPDPHWQTGAQVWSYPPDMPQSWNACTAGTFRLKDDGGDIPLPEYDPFVVYVAESCTARAVFKGGDSLEEAQRAYVDRALATFEAAESWAVEREFAKGVAVPANPYLADANADVLVAGAQIPRVGLSYLANALGATGRNGIIHATPAIVSAWGLFRSYRDSEALFTTEGTPIAEGTGYIGAVPVGEAALADGQDWAFVTGPVDIRRSEVIVYPGNVSQALSRDNNTITYRVERTYLVDWDTVLQGAVLINWASTNV